MKLGFLLSMFVDSTATYLGIELFYKGIDVKQLHLVSVRDLIGRARRSKNFTASLLLGRGGGYSVY